MIHIFFDSSDVVNVTCFVESRGAFIIVVHLLNSLAEASKGNPLGKYKSTMII